MKTIYILISLILLQTTILNATGRIKSPSRKAPFSYIEAEILLFEGVQYFTVMGKHNKTTSVGEIEVLKLNQPSGEVLLTMYSIGERKGEYKILSSCTAKQKDDRCKTMTFAWVKSMGPFEVLSCELETVYRNNLYWFTGDYKCDKEDVNMKVLNDNSPD